MPHLSSTARDSDLKLAPELSVSSWLNIKDPLSLHALRGKVVLIHAFQMLCAGCVRHSIPQASALSDVFGGDEFQLIGLHSVFEHHDVMSPAALKVFATEQRLIFPIAIDRHQDGSPLPETMKSYDMRGTPTLILIDRQGKIRAHHFGQVDDMVIAGQIGALLAAPSLPMEDGDVTENGNE